MQTILIPFSFASLPFTSYTFHFWWHFTCHFTFFYVLTIQSGKKWRITRKRVGRPDSRDIIFPIGSIITLHMLWTLETFSHFWLAANMMRKWIIFLVFFFSHEFFMFFFFRFSFFSFAVEWKKFFWWWKRKFEKNNFRFNWRLRFCLYYKWTDSIENL